jgi:hypothetical protein
MVYLSGVLPSRASTPAELTATMGIPVWADRSFFMTPSAITLRQIFAVQTKRVFI